MKQILKILILILLTSCITENTPLTEKECIVLDLKQYEGQTYIIGNTCHRDLFCNYSVSLQLEKGDTLLLYYKGEYLQYYEIKKIKI